MNRTWLLLAAGTALGGFYAYEQVRSFRRPGPDGHGGGQRPRVVILGGGFGGLAAANALGRHGAGTVDVLLIDKNNYHLFTPPLFQVAACGVNPWDVAHPIRPIGKRNGYRFRCAEVDGIDLDGRHIGIASGQPIDYDYLIVALGSTTNYFHQADAEKYGLPLKSVEDALDVRNRVLDAVEQASRETDAALRRELLTFVIVGGGATGVEVAGAMRDLIYEILAREYQDLDLSLVKIVVIESRDRLLGHVGGSLARASLRHLTGSGVEVMLGTKVRRVQQDLVETDDGRIIRARTIIWTAGVQANELAEELDVPKGKGNSLKVDEYLRLADRTNAFAVGDIASFQDPDTGEPTPLLASVAIQQGKAAAGNVLRAIRGQDLIPFHYHHFANMVSLGRNAGAAELDGLTFTGLAGWLLWKTVHLALLTGFRDKLGIAMDWAFSYFNRQDTSRLRIEEQKTPVPSRPT